MRFYRPVLPSAFFCFIVAAYLLFWMNTSFWLRAFSYFHDHPMKLAILAIALLCLFAGGLTIFSLRFVIKPLAIFLILIAAVSSYYTDKFGVIIDRHVIESTFATTPTESSHLITSPMLAHIFLYGIVPCLMIVWVRLKHRSFFKKVAFNTFAVLSYFVIGFGLIYADFSSYVAMYRDERSVMMEKLIPVTPIKSTVQYIGDMFERERGALELVGRDAKTNLGPHADGKKRLLVIVVGETARAQSFSLGGYKRETNPLLAKRDILYFPNTTSCGTDTSVSVPCMFSVYPRKKYSGYKGKNSENLMDIFNHTGLQTYWWENNTGSKGVGDRITIEEFQNDNDPVYCTSAGECRDAILVDTLAKRIDGLNRDTVLVLHTLGSHGPAYYLRYPRDEAPFQPECLTSEFSDCTREQIVNSYDNTIVYTDKLLDRVISILKSREETLDTAMIYMSDHGESLGEDGLYLHAMPYAIAPDTQTHIPFIMWLSQGFATDNHVDMDCVRRERDKAYSHDNLFHTALGLMDVSTQVYDHRLDVLAACRVSGR